MSERTDPTRTTLVGHFDLDVFGALLKRAGERANELKGDALVQFSALSIRANTLIAKEVPKVLSVLQVMDSQKYSPRTTVIPNMQFTSDLIVQLNELKEELEGIVGWS